MCIFVENKINMGYTKEEKARILSNKEHLYFGGDFELDINLEKSVVLNGVSQNVSIKVHEKISSLNFQVQDYDILSIGIRNYRKKLEQLLNDVFQSESSNKTPDCNDECDNRKPQLQSI